jgi:hypothetical protein
LLQVAVQFYYFSVSKLINFLKFMVVWSLSKIVFFCRFSSDEENQSEDSEESSEDEQVIAIHFYLFTLNQLGVFKLLHCLTWILI